MKKEELIAIRRDLHRIPEPWISGVQNPAVFITCLGTISARQN